MIPRRAIRAVPVRRWVLLAALLLAATVSGWMLYSLDFDASKSARRPADAPDAWIERFVTVEMDGTGKPERRLEAEYMAFNGDETVVLTRPHYVLHRAEGEPWNVRSERGRVSADGSTVVLQGEVAIWREDASGARDLDIRTEDLRVLPDTEYAETAKPVTIRTPAGTTTGVGMRAYLGESRVELLARVRTRVDGHRAVQ